MEAQLKEACRLTGASWAALAEREGGQWRIEIAYRLAKSRAAALKTVLGQESVDAGLAATLNGANNQSGPLPSEAKLEGAKLYVFPVTQTSQVLLVGARQMSLRQQGVWRLVSELISTGDHEGHRDLVPDLQVELSYDLPRALDRMLAAFVRVANPQGAWLAIRRGDVLDVMAQSNDAQSIGLSLAIESNPFLRRMNRTRADILVKKDRADWDQIPHAAVKSSTKVWCCFPLVVGQRLIGAVALWKHSEFGTDEWSQLAEIARQISSPVEVVVTFSELANHLRRLGMLNDFALTMSSAQNLDQIARRVFGLLSRSFSAELISLYIPSADERLMREFTNREGKFGAQNVALAGHSVLSFLKAGRVLHLGDLADAESKSLYSDARSVLLVPLKYRGRTIGLLGLESTHAEAFNQFDEHLIVVIASYLAGLIEYGRLREEAEARARNLGLIHEVVQQIIGLSNKTEIAQITADLVAQYFGYELAAVMLVKNGEESLIVGLGGSRSEVVRPELKHEELLMQEGIMGHVFNTGGNILVNDTAHAKLYKSLHHWNAGSEMCVALKHSDQVFGIIDVESSQQNAFSNNDLVAMESLAGVLATVVSSADQYERQLETVRQLRAAQVELKARMTAQQEAERRLLQAAKLAAVGEMAAGIAHELNNPLTTVTGFTELILDETPSDGPHRADIELVLKEARRARDVVRRLLDFARQGERTRSKSDINEVVEDVLMLTRHLIHTSGVQLSLELTKDLPWVSVDTNQMKQVFLNLIHNALQAMPTGGNLEIRTSMRTKDDRAWIATAIKDSGLGIDAKNRERIFEPFFTTKGDQGGTGLGLSVSYGIVTDHGGTIEVDSSADKGSTFVVLLPV
ncbi:MAG TPA: GAF domain-containing protein [Anaerolineales bacterium]|nr:GAF domain-containing protein [Anaerolineales bacterium]